MFPAAVSHGAEGPGEVGSKKNGRPEEGERSVKNQSYEIPLMI